MKRILLLTFVLCLVASAASAAGFGVRGGYTLDPDHFHVGAHYNVGQIFQPMRLVPNIEIGLDDKYTLWAFNADLIWDIPESAFSIGGELGLNVTDYDGGSNSDLGLSVLGDFRFSEKWFVEAKFGLVDSPDVKFTAGYTF